MANIISDETIEYVGILAKLELSPKEKEEAKKDMGRMLDYIDKLNELDTRVPGGCGHRHGPEGPDSLQCPPAKGRSIQSA